MLLRRTLLLAALALLSSTRLPAQDAVKRMPPNADPAFEVATIKPANPEDHAKNFSFEGRIFRAQNYNVEDLIALAYGLHSKQVGGEPGWFATTLYDIEGIPDVEGLPNQQQKYAMIQKLLADRFKLTFHLEKRELAVYAIKVAIGGPRLTPSIATADDPERFRWQGRLGDLSVTNMTISEFAVWFQKNVTEKPIVDHTGLIGRYDFTLVWTPGESEFPQFRRTGGFNPSPTPTDNLKAPPDLYKAFQEQLGLKLLSIKAPVDVMVIDHAQKPSPN
ncbi:MAG TPA: TIGR03435 family protein [Acidobacteriaceae bacterium]